MLRGSILQCLLIGLVLVLSSCATAPGEQLFKADGPTTEQIWRGGGSGAPLLQDQVGVHAGTPDGAYTRRAERELQVLFPELHNRRLHLYVFPHLTAGGAPVPGYTTAFYLYEQSQIFALPGEALQQGGLP